MTTALDERGAGSTSLSKLTRVAAGIAVPLIVLHLLSLRSISEFGEMYEGLGADLAPLMGTLLSMGPFLLGGVVLLFDLAIFAGCYYLARKTWEGLVFVPLVIYLALPTLIVLFLYAPMFQIFDLIK